MPHATQRSLCATGSMLFPHRLHHAGVRRGGAVSCSLDARAFPAPSLSPSFLDRAARVCCPAGMGLPGLALEARSFEAAITSVVHPPSRGRVPEPVVLLAQGKVEYGAGGKGSGAGATLALGSLISSCSEGCRRKCA